MRLTRPFEGYPWLASLIVLASLACSCDTPAAFPIPAGPHKTVALDSRLPVPILGHWAVDDFNDTLRGELAKYHIDVVPSLPKPDVVAEIDLGQFTYRDWQEIDVALAYGGSVTPLGRIRIIGLSQMVLDAAAVPVAELIARGIWQTPLGSPAP